MKYSRKQSSHWEIEVRKLRGGLSWWTILYCRWRPTSNVTRGFYFNPNELREWEAGEHWQGWVIYWKGEWIFIVLPWCLLSCEDSSLELSRGVSPPPSYIPLYGKVGETILIRKTDLSGPVVCRDHLLSSTALTLSLLHHGDALAPTMAGWNFYLSQDSDVGISFCCHFWDAFSSITPIPVESFLMRVQFTTFFM